MLQFLPSITQSLPMYLHQFGQTNFFPESMFSLAMLTILPFCSLLFIIIVNFSAFPLPRSATKDLVHVAAVLDSPLSTSPTLFDNGDHWGQ